MPKEPNLNMTVGMRINKEYIPFPLGPKVRAKIIEVTNPTTKINIFDEKVIILFLDKLFIQYKALFHSYIIFRSLIIIFNHVEFLNTSESNYQYFFPNLFYSK